jgi:L,D-peptidoglycan transpeptidase YkuD (ErfK/YbiS/YcfS/YnhG family)
VSELICEELIARPSEIQGWTQYGFINDSGEFEPLYGLESGLSLHSALYYLDAAGVCDIGGQYQMGQPVPVESAPLVVANNIEAAPAIATVEVPPTPVSQVEANPVTEASGGAWFIGIAFALALGAAGVVWSAKQRSKNDPTPGVKMPNPFNKGGD